MNNLTPVVLYILLANVFFYLLGQVTGMAEFGTQLFGLHHWQSESFKPWQFITYMFLHADFMHLFSNMLGILVFGPMLERFWGSARFFQYYFITGVGAGLIYYGYHAWEVYQMSEAAQAFFSAPDPQLFLNYVSNHAQGFHESNLAFENAYDGNPSDPQLQYMAKEIVSKHLLGQIDTPMIGASGALYGVLIGFGRMFPNTELMLLFPPIPLPAWLLVTGYGVFALVNAINQNPGDNVAHFAHLGGMIVGWFLISIWQRDRGRFY